MRRVAVYRDGNQIAAQIDPDWVQGIAAEPGDWWSQQRSQWKTPEASEITPE
jgi:hypothetical protein